MIEVEHVCLSFGKRKILEDVNLTVYDGETMVILGASGSGKSTLLKLIIGLLKPDSGSIKVNGKEISSLTEREMNEERRRMGMVFQYSALFDSMNVKENVAFGLRQHTDLSEEEIENILRHDEELARPTGEKVGFIRHRNELAWKYKNYILSTVKGDFKGMKIVTDSANGAASGFLPDILRELGAEITALYCEPNGVNINKDCGSTHMETLQKMVVEMGADCGIANDGDADRCLFVDEQGNIMDGDHIMVINALRMKKEGRLNANMVVGTVMSYLGFGKALAEHGCRTVATNVGDRYVLEEMKAHGYSLGGEQSGHITFLDYMPTGDAQLCAVQLLGIMAKTGLTVDDMDLIEANEAFAAQSIAVARDLKFDMSKVNVNGGAIALGHPVGASGCRILVTLLHEMQKRGSNRGLATLCIGGGMGCSTIVEKY